MSEIEAKMLMSRPAQLGEVLEELAELGHRVEKGPSESIVDTYFDTPDWLISRAGWAYRCREKGDARTLTLKTLSPGEGAVFVRDEVDQPLAADVPPGGQLPSGPVQERLDSIVNGHPRRELFRVRNRRTCYEIKAAGEAATSIEMAVDRAEIVADREGSEPVRFMELELELNQGDSSTVSDLARVLGERVGLLDAQLSKFERGLQVVGIERPEDMGTLPPVQISRESAMLDVAYAQIARQVSTLELQQPRAWEGIDPRGVHQMRIATRRLRAALRVFRALLPTDAVARFGRELRWLAGVLGDVRDADVYDQHFSAHVATLPEKDVRALTSFQQRMRVVRQAARVRLLEALGGRRYQRLIADLEHFTRAGPTSGMRRRFGGLTVGYGADRCIREAIVKMLKRGRRIHAGSTKEQIHKLRIRGKRLRYLMEFFSELYCDELRRPLGACKRLQDVLGEYHDDVVACAYVRAYADSLPLKASSRSELLALGRLLQNQAEHSAAALASFPKSWQRFERAMGRI